MEKIRGFEVAKGWEDKNINLPIRKTKYSAGYDIEAAEDVVVPANHSIPTLIKTGIKAYMPRIFQKYYLADNDNAEGERQGGFGSTNK